MRIADHILPLCAIGAVVLTIGATSRPTTTTTTTTTTRPTTRSDERELSPYAPDPNHLWNRLHRTLFLRTAPDGSQYIHSVDPLLYRGGTFLLRGDSYSHAIAALDEFLARHADPSFETPVKRLILQRDLWAAFDYVAWYPDDWVFKKSDEPAAIALRTRLAKAIGQLALTHEQIDALPDNYALAVHSGEFAADYDRAHPERPFLPANLFDPGGPWVRFRQDVDDQPAAPQHFAGVGGRSAHLVFLRLPGGREATLQYLKSLRPDHRPEFPVGTMAALVRKAFAVDRDARMCVTPITELVQIRVYRRIPADPQANFNGDFGEQDVYEFALDRPDFFAGKHGLRPVTPDTPAQSFDHREGDPFVRLQDGKPSFHFPPPSVTALQSCKFCHQEPGVYSMLSIQPILNRKPQQGNLFTTYELDVELKGTVLDKTKRFDWGLLHGLLEAGGLPR